MAAVARQMSRFRGFSLETGALLSRAGRGKASFYTAMLSTCKYCPAHQNREDNVNKNVKTNHSLPGNGAKILIVREVALKSVFYVKLMKSSNMC